MTIEYSQLAQARENSTNAVSVYSPGAGETVQIFAKVANTTAATAKVRVFHDNDGTTYDETTTIAWDVEIEPGQFLEIDKVFMDNSAGNLAYRSDTANALVMTVYGIVKS
ncbi:MAG: hypothetical protein HN597_03580 [Desulfobacula sp.]|jgi:hypothetical protein|uniref:hypothetical protein n=1 Tax=Desulfobacula sp. TaxID=2593537 RepID=UPI0039B9A83C|nr:hypothetical protein [Desulfobacula sp.]